MMSRKNTEFEDSLDTLQRTFSGVKNNLVGELLPGFSTVLNGLSELLVGGKDAKEKIQKGTQDNHTFQAVILSYRRR